MYQTVIEQSVRKSPEGKPEDLLFGLQISYVEPVRGGQVTFHLPRLAMGLISLPNQTALFLIS